MLDLLSLLILTQLSFGFPKPTVGTFKPSKVSCRLCWYLKSKSSYIKSNRWISGLIFLTVYVSKLLWIKMTPYFTYSIHYTNSHGRDWYYIKKCVNFLSRNHWILKNSCVSLFFIDDPHIIIKFQIIMWMKTTFFNPQWGAYSKK